MLQFAAQKQERYKNKKSVWVWNHVNQSLSLFQNGQRKCPVSVKISITCPVEYSPQSFHEGQGKNKQVSFKNPGAACVLHRRE